MPGESTRSLPEARSAYPDLLQVSFFFALVVFYSSGAGALPPALQGLGGLLFLQVVGLFGLPLLMMRAQQRPLRTVFRLRPLHGPGWLKATLLGLLLFPLTQGLFLVFTTLLTLLGGHISDPNAGVHQLNLPLQFAIGALLPAVCEEWAYRGFVLSGALRFPPLVAALFTGVLFSAMHLSFLRFVPLAVLGFTLSLAALRTGSLLPGMIGHLLNNALALLLTGITLPTLPPLLSLLLWAAIAAAAAFGVHRVLRSLGPLGAQETETPPPWQRAWQSGERLFWVPLAIAALIFLAAGLGEVATPSAPR